MRKGITPIIAIIILLLITIGLAASAWTYMSMYFAGLTGKAVELSDFFCTGGTTANIVVRNIGTEGMTLSSCTGTGDTRDCGDVTVIRTAGGGTFTPSFDSTSVSPQGMATFTDSGCTTAGTPTICKYRFLVEASGRASSGSVSCQG